MRPHLLSATLAGLVAAWSLAPGLVGERARAEPITASPRTAEQNHQLHERDRLWAEAQKRRVQGRLAEALAALEKVLALQRQLFGNGKADEAVVLASLAQLHAERADWASAQKARQQVLAIKTKLLGSKHWQVTDARLALSHVDQLSRLKPEQRRQLQKAEQLNRPLVRLYQQGKQREALGPAQQVLKIRQDLLGEDHPDTAQSLNDLALLYQALGDHARARPLLKRALAIRKQVLGDRHPDYAVSLNNLALLYKARGDYALAEPLYKQALVIDKQALGEKHPGYATDLNNLAHLYYLLGDHARAEPLYQKALAIWKRAAGENHPDYASALSNLAVLSQAMGNYARAESLHLQALAIRKQALGAQHPDYAQSLLNLAYLAYARGDYARSEPLYLKALPLSKQALGEHHPDYAQNLNNLALLYQAMGDFAQAEPLHLKALAIRKQALGTRHPDYAQSLHNLAYLYYALGDHARAEPLYRQALALSRQTVGTQHPDYAASLNNLALLYQAVGDHARAEPLFQQALAIDKKALGETHPGYATDLHNLAHLHALQGKYAQAEPLYRQALAILKQTLGENHPAHATALHNLALLHLSAGDPQRAEPLSRQAVQAMGRLADLTAAVQSERQQLVMIAQLRHFLDAYLAISAAAKVPGEQVYAEVLAWKGTVWARQEWIRHRRRALHGGARPEVVRLHAELTRAMRQLATLSLAPATARKPQQRPDRARLSAKIEEVQKALAAASPDFRHQLQQRHRTAPALQKVLPAGTALVDLLEYEHYYPPQSGKGKGSRQRRLAAFVVRPDQPVRRLDLGSVEPLSAAIARWRFTLKRTRPVQGAQDPAVTLRRLLWQPLEKHLKGADTVLVSPDGALNRLPLAALPGKQLDTYLVEEVALAVVPVPQLLPDLLAPADREKGGQEPPPALLVLGDVDYDGAAGTARAGGTSRSAARTRAGAVRKWSPLEETGDEITLVSKAFKRRYPRGRVRELTGPEATEEALRQQAPRQRWLHLATHGFFTPKEVRSALAPDPQRSRRAAVQDLFRRNGVSGFHPGLLSGLVLAGANRPPQPDQDDGILTALEVAELDLGGVDLAVLSACETALGEVAGGEGLLGLQRAFQVAGARSVVASLWQVDDRASRELLVRFYKNLWGQKLSRLEALRQAQLWMLREGVQRGLVVLEEVKQPRGKARTPPLYWAAFQLSGDWR